MSGAPRPGVPYLVGESNPYQKPGEDPEHKFDLYPRPRNASGERLCRLVLGMQETEYLRSFRRRDLLEGKWSAPRARTAATALWAESGTAPLVLLGQKVATAFGLAYLPFTSIEHGSGAGLRWVVILPHPSGRSRGWDEPGSFLRARGLVMALLGKPSPAGVIHGPSSGNEAGMTTSDTATVDAIHVIGRRFDRPCRHCGVPFAQGQEDILARSSCPRCGCPIDPAANAEDALPHVAILGETNMQPGHAPSAALASVAAKEVTRG